MSVHPERRAVRVARRAALALAVVGGVWAGGLVVFGGFDSEVFGVRVRSHEPLRPLIAACAAFAVFVFLGGRVRWPLPGLTSRTRRVTHALRAVTRWRPSERGQVLALSLAVTVFGVAYATTVAGGSDSYGYVSQADLWLAGDLRIAQPWAAEASWRSSGASFAPLGYRALDDDWAIVPTYSAGLPLLLAGAKAIGGQEAMFWVVPLLGGVLVLATYGVGRRVAPPGAAVVAAWLTATCPVMLYMVVSPMSDVPVAAVWMSACYFLLRPGTMFGILAGLAAAVAVLIRPNLVFIAAVLAIWPLWQAVWSHEGGRRALRQSGAFGVCAAAGVTAVALINRDLYGSAFVSGYGDLGSLFDRSHLWPNLVKYVSWLIESQTVVAAGGALALVIPWRRLWPEADHRRFLLISGTVVTGVWLLYCLYLEFDAWWFLRFMLPALPFIAIGLGTLAVAIRPMGGRTTATLVTIGLLLVVVLQCRFTADSGALGFWRSERRYVSVGRLVGAHTGANSVIFSMQHSGSLRYYGGRMTLRFDNLDADSLDQAIAWLTSRGVRSYLLVEEWEVPQFRERFAGQAALERLETPQFIYRGPVTAMLFDLERAASGEPGELQDPGESTRSARPAPPTGLFLQDTAARDGGG